MDLEAPRRRLRESGVCSSVMSIRIMRAAIRRGTRPASWRSPSSRSPWGSEQEYALWARRIGDAALIMATRSTRQRTASGCPRTRRSNSRCRLASRGSVLVEDAGREPRELRQRDDESCTPMRDGAEPLCATACGSLRGSRGGCRCARSLRYCCTRVHPSRSVGSGMSGLPATTSGAGPLARQSERFRIADGSTRCASKG